MVGFAWRNTHHTASTNKKLLIVEYVLDVGVPTIPIKGRSVEPLLHIGAEGFFPSVDSGIIAFLLAPVIISIGIKVLDSHNKLILLFGVWHVLFKSVHLGFVLKTFFFLAHFILLFLLQQLDYAKVA